jgi:hypothetical protein
MKECNSNTIDFFVDDGIFKTFNYDINTLNKKNRKNKIKSLI